MRSIRRLLVAVCLAAAVSLQAQTPTKPATPPLDNGQRVFSAGHSFHMFVPGMLRELAQAADIKGHEQAGTQSLGGSRTLQHWNLAEDKNQAKKALAGGKVDVLTLSPIYLPDEGIDHFTELGLKHNPDLRVCVMAFWLPYDVYDVNYQKKRPAKVDRNQRTGADLRKEHAPYFQSVDEQVKALNKLHNKEVVFVVPAGQAAIALREKIIAGEAPGLKMQDDLFTDDIGHAKPALQALTAYCHYAVIYRRSPVGLPLPGVLKKAKNLEDPEKLNKLLQELAWDAVVKHPHSGVKAEK